MSASASEFDTTLTKCERHVFDLVGSALEEHKGSDAIAKLIELFRAGTPANAYCTYDDGSVLCYLDLARNANNEDALAFLIALDHRELREFGWHFKNYLWSRKAVESLFQAGYSFAHEIASPSTSFRLQSSHLGPEFFQTICERGARFDISADGASADRLPIVEFVGEHNVSGVPEVLLANLQDPNVRQADGQCALHGAVRQGPVVRDYLDTFENLDRFKSVLAAFVDAGGDIDLVDNEGRSALNIACSLGYFNKARVLVEAGADPTLIDESGMSPENLIAQAGQQDLLELCAAARAKTAIDVVLAMGKAVLAKPRSEP